MQWGVIVHQACSSLASQNLSIPQCWSHVLSVLTAKLWSALKNGKGLAGKIWHAVFPDCMANAKKCFNCYSQCWCMIKREQTLLNNSTCRDVDLSFLGLICLPKLCRGGFSLATTWYRTRHTFDCPKGHGNISLYNIYEPECNSVVLPAGSCA